MLVTTDMLYALTKSGCPTADLAVADGAHLSYEDIYDDADAYIHAHADCDPTSTPLAEGWTDSPVDRIVRRCVTCTHGWDLWDDVENILTVHRATDLYLTWASAELSVNDEARGARNLVRALCQLEGLDRTAPRPPATDKRHASWIAADGGRLRERFTTVQAQFRALRTRTRQNMHYVVTSDPTYLDEKLATALTVYGQVVYVDHAARPWCVLQIPVSVHDAAARIGLRPVTTSKDLGPVDDTDTSATWAAFSALYNEPAGQHAYNPAELLDTARTIVAA